jgi:hypothetical protein
MYTQALPPQSPLHQYPHLGKITFLLRLYINLFLFTSSFASPSLRVLFSLESLMALIRMQDGVGLSMEIAYDQVPPARSQ